MALTLKNPDKKDWPKHEALEKYLETIKDLPAKEITTEQIDKFFSMTSDALGELIPELEENED